jgi:hypothetical protein
MLMMKAEATHVPSEYLIARTGNKVFRLQMKKNGTKTMSTRTRHKSASMVISFMIKVAPYWQWVS